METKLKIKDKIIALLEKKITRLESRIECFENTKPNHKEIKIIKMQDYNCIEKLNKKQWKK